MLVVVVVVVVCLCPVYSRVTLLASPEGIAEGRACSIN